MKWYNIREKLKKLRALNIIIGGRGIGKTYSTLNFLLETGDKFIYMRNTDTQIKESASAFGNPFKKLNTDLDIDIRIDSEAKHYIINKYDNGKAVECIGYACALSTFENLRGIDLSDVKYVIFDEFIERRTLTFDQFRTFASFIETVNRNREILGEEPVKMILLSNAQKLGNPILAGFNVIPIIERMISRDEEEYITKFLFVDLPKSEISDKKRETSLYQLINGSQYAAEALDNKFSYDSFYGVGKQNVVEYKAQCIIDGLTVYKHKSQPKYYVCTVHADVTEFNSKDHMLLFMRTYGQYYREIWAQGKFYFSDFTTKLKFAKIIGM